MKERIRDAASGGAGDLLPAVSREGMATRWTREGGGDEELRAKVSTILNRVQENGLPALEELAAEFDGWDGKRSLFLTRADCDAVLDELDPETRELLTRTAERIRTFCEKQRSCLRDLETPIPGGRAGHVWKPVERAGCYVPGGRYPLASSMLMTVIPARVAGVREIVAATPGDSPVVLAAAAIAGADLVLRAGGAQAVAALAFGAGTLAPCDVITGPGNGWVTEAKRQIAGTTRIDGLAGPSELLLVADETANPEWAAADLLAQAEHDPEARIALVTATLETRDRVTAAVARQLRSFPEEIRRIMIAALAGGSSFVTADESERIAICDELAAEHLQLSIAAPESFLGKLAHYGTAFLGEDAPTALGDYGAGPNHTLPTGRAARKKGGLSVLDYLRCVTWMRIETDGEGGDCRSAESFAKLEGLAGHARSLALRLDA
ncbi:MAG: histidinol dehydrogenase [Gemmatimonadetes bacterium]|nr:histidinol dehydrogenase [Gemmatimonadota bacterium]